MKYFTIQYIKQSRCNPQTNQPEYLVHWKGYDSDQDQWIPFQKFQFNDQISIKKQSLKSKEDDKIIQINKFMSKFTKIKDKNVKKNKKKGAISKVTKIQKQLKSSEPHQRQLKENKYYKLRSGFQENDEIASKKQKNRKIYQPNKEQSKILVRKCQNFKQRQNDFEKNQRENMQCIQQSQSQFFEREAQNKSQVDEYGIKQSKYSFEKCQNGLDFIRFFQSSQNGNENFLFQDSSRLVQDLSSFQEQENQQENEEQGLMLKSNQAIKLQHILPTQNVSYQIQKSKNPKQLQKVSKKKIIINGNGPIAQQSLSVEQQYEQTSEYLTCEQLKAKSKQLRKKSKAIFHFCNLIKNQQIQLGHYQLKDLSQRLKQVFRQKNMLISRNNATEHCMGIVQKKQKE